MHIFVHLPNHSHNCLNLISSFSLFCYSLSLKKLVGGKVGAGLRRSHCLLRGRHGLEVAGGHPAAWTWEIDLQRPSGSFHVSLRECTDCRVPLVDPG